MDTDYTRKSRFSATRRKEREGKGINVKPETIAQNNRKKVEIIAEMKQRFRHGKKKKIQNINNNLHTHKGNCLHVGW